MGYEPKIVCFSCKFGWGYLNGDAEIVSHVKHWIPVICSGKVDAKYIVEAFHHGADGVLILGCPVGSCHYQDGNIETKKKVHLLYNILGGFGIEKERLRIEFNLDPEGKTIPELVNHMIETLRPLGPARTKARIKMAPQRRSSGVNA